MSAPRRPVGLRADQNDAWEDVAADQYGGPAPTPYWGPIDEAWIDDAQRAIDEARARREQ
jgi:hypothetical protein